MAAAILAMTLGGMFVVSALKGVGMSDLFREALSPLNPAGGRKRFGGSGGGGGDVEGAADGGRLADRMTGSGLETVCKRFTGSYLYGGGHGKPLSSLKVSDSLDCSSSSSLALKLAGHFPGNTPITSGGFANWGKPGQGDQWSVYYNAGHVFIQSERRDHPWRFDTGGPDGGNGPRYRKTVRSTSGFKVRSI